MINVEHLEEEDFGNGKLQWSIGTGCPNNPVKCHSTAPPVHQGEQNESIDSWDVTNFVNTPKYVNSLELRVYNNDNGEKKKTMVDYIYVDVSWTTGLPPNQVTTVNVVPDQTVDFASESIILDLQNQITNLDSEDTKNLDDKVSHVANLYDSVAGATKEDRVAFKDAFHDYMDKAKNIAQKGQGLEQKIIAQNIGKTKLKLDDKLAKIDEKEDVANKISSAIELSSQKRELIKTRNKIVALDNLIKEGEDKEKILKELQDKKTKLHKLFVTLEAKHNNIQLREDNIKEIEESFENENNSKSESKTTDTKSNSGNGGESDKGTSDKGSSDKGSSDKGSSDKGSSDKGSSDKGTSDKGSSDKGSSAKGSSDKGSSAKGSSDKGSSAKGTSDKGNSAKGTSDKGKSDKGSSDKGKSDKGSSDKGKSDKGNKGNSNNKDKSKK